jgi:hypothetical protein
MKTILIVMMIAIVSVGATAKDHNDEYQTGTFLELRQVDGGAVATSNCGALGCGSTAQSVSYNVAVIATPDGAYALADPISFGASFAAGMAGVNTLVRTRWFVDSLHTGDKISFRVKCKRNNDLCTFWVRIPDALLDKDCYRGCDKEIKTDGRFEPLATNSDPAAARKTIISLINDSFKKENVVGYAEQVEDKLVIHSERASMMRFQMGLLNVAELAAEKKAGFKTYVYTNDADKTFVYDYVTEKVVSPAEAAAK